MTICNRYDEIRLEELFFFQKMFNIQPVCCSVKGLSASGHHGINRGIFTKLFGAIWLIYIHINIHIYIYIYVCDCVCVCFKQNSLGCAF